MSWRILQGDALEMLKTLSDESVHCCVCSPPYWGLRDYGTARWEGGLPDCDHILGMDRPRSERPRGNFHGGDDKFHPTPFKDACGKCGAIRRDGQIGLEKTPELYVSRMVEVFREVRRVLRKDGTLWLNLGDSYCGSNTGYESNKIQGNSPKQATNPGANFSGFRKPVSWKPKDLCGIPWLVAFALRADGWYLRQDIIWAKPNPMPESVTDRCTKAHEYLFLLSKSSRYYYDAEAIAEPMAWSSYARLDQDVENQEGSPVPFKTNGNMKVVAKSHLPGNKTHKGQAAYEDGAEEHRTKAGLLDYCERAREQAESGELPSTRNRRSVWEVTTQPFPEAHFATFPPKLIEPCILAGTSDRGCCAKCGAPWKRVTESEFRPQPDIKNPAKLAKSGLKGLDSSNGWGEMPRGSNSTVTTGWEPSCRCGAETKPCTVLDPFAGAGTTGLVATRFQRNFIGIELNPAYVKMAEKRITEDQPLFNSGANAACTEEERR